VEDKKGIWHGGTTKPNGGKMSEDEAKFWRGFEDYNDNVGLEKDFAAEYQIEKEMRENKTEMSGGDPILKRKAK